MTSSFRNTTFSPGFRLLSCERTVLKKKKKPIRGLSICWFFQKSSRRVPTWLSVDRRAEVWCGPYAHRHGLLLSSVRKSKVHFPAEHARVEQWSNGYCSAVNGYHDMQPGRTSRHAEDACHPSKARNIKSHFMRWLWKPDYVDRSGIC